MRLLFIVFAFLIISHNPTFSAELIKKIGIESVLIGHYNYYLIKIDVSKLKKSKKISRTSLPN